MNTNCNNQRGIALMMVLWALTILMVIVLSFSFMTGTETHSTLSFKEGIENKFLAEAGVERGIMELFYRKQNFNTEGAGVWKTDATPYTVQMGNGYYTVKLTDENGKVDINAASDVILKNLVLNLGASGELADIIVDSIMDWKDSDDLHRLHGAESDYYMSLQNAYKAKNANFESLEELQMIKGISSEILYGNSGKKGLIDCLTVNSKNRLVNVNAAPLEVLMAIPGMTQELAAGIIAFRESVEIRNMADIQGLLGTNYATMSQYITIGIMGNVFTIEASGHKLTDKSGYTIRATIAMEGDNKYSYLYYKCPVYAKQ